MQHDSAMQRVPMTRRWLAAAIAVVSTAAGCSFTNDFEVPAVIGVWRNTVFTINSARTDRRRNLLTIEEDGTGEGVFHFTLEGDQSDQLYSDTFDVAWSRDAGEYLMRLECRETTAPVACTPVDMPCSLTSDGASLICFYAVLNSTYTFERVPAEGEAGS